MIKFEEGEEVIKIVRRHYFVILPFVTTILLGLLAPIVIVLFLVSDFLALDPELVSRIRDVVADLKYFGYSLWALFLWTIFFIEWTDYYLDIWVITNKRVIDVEQKGFFHREVTSLSYERIQDITVETRGFIETLFKFGTLHVQTAGSHREIVIKDAYYPEEARSLMVKLQNEFKKDARSDL